MPNNARAKRKSRVGVVVSDKMDKTITVRVERVTHHPVYDKLMRKAKKFKVHDEKESAGPGDLVLIEETRPMSKTKRWRLMEILKRAAQAAAKPAPEPEPEKQTKTDGAE